MIAKPRTIPLVILILEALLRHLPVNHPKRQQISDELGGRMAGYHGEASLDYYYRSLDQKKFLILHDLNLPDDDYNCQIDTLILAPEFALVIEVKHMAGKLVFDTDNEQLIQIVDGKEKGYSYPIAQAESHQKYIQDFLKENGLPALPVEYQIVLSNQYCTYSFTGRHGYKYIQKVCKSDILLKKIANYEANHTLEVLSAKDLRKLSKLLIKKNTVPTRYVLKKYVIQKWELINGVHCPKCFYLPLRREKQQWYCPPCDTYFKDAHIGGLQDYFLLFGPTITNQEFRAFAGVGSRDVSKRLLRDANLASSGANKGKVYFQRSIPIQKS